MQDRLRYTHEQWNQRIESVNYDQAWAYIQFLAHGDGGKDRAPLVRYIRDVGAGQDPVTAFRANLGEPEEVQRRFTQWVADLPGNPTLELYGQAAVAAVTNVVACAAASQQVIRSMDELAALIARRQLRCPEEARISVQTVEELLPLTEQLGAWRIAPGSRRGPSAVVLRLRDGTMIRGMFAINRGQVVRVWIESQPPASTSSSRESR